MLIKPYGVSEESALINPLYSMTQHSPQEILIQAFRHRLQVIADSAFRERDATGHLQAIAEASLSIEKAAADLPQPVDPQLQHFLDRRSFEKALAFLEAR